MLLGMLNYYACNLPNLSTVLAPLHELLAKDSKWTWGKRQEAAFNQAKGMLAERNYAQLDKEGAVVIFGLRKLHQYVYDQKFIILTDRKPPLGLFKADKAVLTIASPRIQRWALLLEAYNHELV